MNHARDAFLDDQATLKLISSHESAVSQLRDMLQQLRLVHGHDLLNYFQFKHKAFVHEEIDPESCVDAEVVINDRERHLAANAQAALLSSCAMHFSYTLSNRPGPSLRWTRCALSTAASQRCPPHPAEV